MPVVAIKLNDQAKRRDKSIHAELLSDEMLRVIRYLQRIKGRVACYLKLGPLHSLLREVHSYQHPALFGIGVSAFDGAVFGSVLAVHGQRWGTSKIPLAAFTDMGGFVSALPLIDARNATKMKRVAFYEAARLIGDTLTLMTSNVFASFSDRSARRPIAWKRAIFRLRRTMLFNKLSASSAIE